MKAIFEHNALVAKKRGIIQNLDESFTDILNVFGKWGIVYG